MKEDYLNSKEAALFIGKKSAGAVRNLVMRRAIPYRKVAGRLFFLRSELELWISQAPGLTLTEIEDERS